MRRFPTVPFAIVCLSTAASAGLWSLPLSAQTDAPTPRADSLAASAEGGDAEAQYQYGRLYETGTEGISVDYTTALEWYRRAAEQEHLAAMMSASTMLLGSDPQEAMRLVVQAADIGDAEAQWRAGQVYAGRIYLPLSGVSQDRDAAIRWFRMGAEQEHLPSEEALADLYTDSDDDSQYVEALQLYERAADLGNSAWAVLRLGMIYATGEGVDENDETAREWLSRLGAGYQLNPEIFSNEELEVLGGLQWYYGLDFMGGEGELDPSAALEAFDEAIASVENAPMVRPFLHPSFLRVSRRMSEKLQN